LIPLQLDGLVERDFHRRGYELRAYRKLSATPID
jgi:hypothetical protein